MALMSRSHVKIPMVLTRYDYKNYKTNYYLCKYNYKIVIAVLFWGNPFIPSRNLDEAFTYNNMDLISLLSGSHVKAYACIHIGCIHDVNESLSFI